MGGKAGFWVKGTELGDTQQNYYEFSVGGSNGAMCYVIDATGVKKENITSSVLQLVYQGKGCSLAHRRFVDLLMTPGTVFATAHSGQVKIEYMANIMGTMMIVTMFLPLKDPVL